MKKWTVVSLLILYILAVGVTVGLKNIDWVKAQVNALVPPATSIPQFERVVAEPSSEFSTEENTQVEMMAVQTPAEQPEPTTSQAQTQTNTNIPVPGTCALQPDPNPPASGRPGPAINPVTLYRFRRPEDLQASSSGTVGYAPNEYQAIANPTNYGQRFLYDIAGRPVNQAPIIVLHETVSDAYSAVNFFQTPHASEDNQASYHTLIMLTGDIVYIVPPDLRAYGAGNSVFAGPRGTESVSTHAKRPPSVNNFAYHISLETPPDGRNNKPSHSGYTTAQYQTLAWLVAKTGVPDERITTHAAVDRSGERQDPRSFDAQTFFQLLQSYPRTQEIVINCQLPYLN